MNKKFSLGVCISLIAIACAITFVLTMNIALGIYNSKITGVEEREEIYTKLEEADSYFRGNYIGEINEDVLLSEIMNGYIKGTGDVNGRYLSPAEYYEFRQIEEGRLITAGILAEPEESGYIRVSEVYPDSSAALQGIKKNDIITAVNGTDVLETGAETAIRQLSGDEGTRLIIKIQRDGTEQQFTLIRQLITLVSVTGDVYGEIGYIRINGFSGVSARQFEEELGKLNEAGVKGLIIDLRGTSSHLIVPVRDIVNFLIPSGLLATAEYKGESVNNIIVTSGSGTPLPIVVLTDGNTGGSAELMTALLKDFKEALVVGGVTSGKAVLQHTQSLRDGSAVTISYITVSSSGATDFNGTGINPDYLVETTPFLEINPANFSETEDLQVKKALEVMTTRLEFIQ